MNVVICMRFPSLSRPSIRTGIMNGVSRYLGITPCSYFPNLQTCC
jgi:hypothetical protein